MKKYLGILFCILSVACLAAAVVVGMIFGMLYALLCILGGAVFAGLMLLVKREKPVPPEQKPDFLKSEEENRAIHEKHTPRGRGEQ